MVQNFNIRRLRNSFIQIPTLLATTAMLAACGGGSGLSEQLGGETGKNAAPETPAVAAPRFGACWTWTPGTKYTESNGYKTLIVAEEFEGQKAIGHIELRPDDSRFGGPYVVVNDTHVRILGIVTFNKSKVVHDSAAVMPVKLAAGQTLHMSYSATSTSLNPPFASNTEVVNESITFVDFEDVTLAGRTFKNACKISTPDANGNTRFVWVAPGFGYIQSEQRTAQGALVAGSRVELTSIISAP